MTYPRDILFDIETLVSEAQPSTLLLLGDGNSDLLNSYIEQTTLLGKGCTITRIQSSDINKLATLNERFDLAIVINLFEHIDKTQAQQVLARLRDVNCSQFCLALAMHSSNLSSNSNSNWSLTDLFAMALQRVSSYSQTGIDDTTQNHQYALFKYNIKAYKQTPNWLNSDNWANPNMWNKYRW